MRNSDLFPGGAHASPSKVLFQDGEPIRPLSECPAPCAQACQRPKLFQRQAGWPGGTFVGGQAYRSNISVAAAATLRATVGADSGVDIGPGVVGALVLGGTRHMSGPLGAILRPPISIAVSVSV